MKEIINYIGAIAIGAGILMAIIYGGHAIYKDFKSVESVQSDSSVIKKQLEKPVFKSARVAATIDNCKIYEFASGNGPVYAVICTDEKGKVISTSITK